MRPVIFLILFFFSCGLLFGQSIFGKWKTIDDKSGIEKAVVEIYEYEGLVYGKVVEILEQGRENELCTKCKGEDKNKPIVGIKVIKGLKFNGKDEYKGGRLFDPEYGVEVRGKIWLQPKNKDKLMVRGYLAFLYRTQTWLRVKD
ncbi:MAG: DUF2147 domain-containing protein [Allomuricauda sp.]|nr:MAG: DUF2147 domain-containing protein [Allomuricauda sp.]